VSLLNLAQQPELVLGLAVIALWLRWRRRPSLWLEISIGVCAGWATITRPIDAICFVAPIFLAMLVRELRLRPRRVGMTFITCVVGAAPLIGLQLFFDRGVTGHWLTTPVSVCLARDLPGLNYGLRTPDRSLRPQTHLAQKIVFYDSAILPQIQREQQHNRIVNWYHEFGGGLPAIGLPVALLVVLIPSSLLVLWRRPAVCVLLAPLILYLVLYPMYPFFAAHYLFVIIPLCAALVAMGVHGIAQTAEPNRAAFVETILFTIVLAMSIASLPELNRRLLDQSPEHFATLRTIEAKIDALPRVPSIVLFHNDPRRDNPHEEPMHNTDSAWPDDELIIRAHDLGARNHELFDYFAKREPSRRVYLCDQEDATIRYLGMVGELARAN
jgi:hypothetical protein